jgi:hypothetical protein
MIIDGVTNPYHKMARESHSSPESVIAPLINWPLVNLAFQKNG